MRGHPLVIVSRTGPDEGETSSCWCLIRVFSNRVMSSRSRVSIWRTSSRRPRPRLWKAKEMTPVAAMNIPNTPRTKAGWMVSGSAMGVTCGVSIPARGGL